MKPKNSLYGLLMAIFVAILVFTSAQSVSAQTADSLSITGWFTIIWGDGPAGSSAEGTIYTLTDDSGQTTVLSLDETLAQSLGGILSLNRKYVRLEGVRAATVINVTSISLAPAPGAEAPDAAVSPVVIGSKPWVSIMCKFSDFATEPNNLAYFQGMYSSTKPGLDHYWRELSYDTANVAGSNAYGWFVLPHTEAYYNPTDTGQGTNLDLLATDCTAAANASVNFALYQDGGINMMFNTDFDNGWAWGGGKYMTLDGVAKVWSITWEPPWSYASISVIEHEMGHGFGLPHSSGNYGATYDNAWDVMSQDRYNCAAATDPTYGCMAQHTITYHKDLLGWIPASQKFTHTGGVSTITLEQLALPQTTNYKMAKISIGGSSTNFYTVEARLLTGYDVKLAGAAVIIHEVDTTRSRPAYVIDTDNNGNTADAGAMWVVGETFTDAAHGISVKVDSATSTGFQITITTASSSIPTLISPVGTITDTTPLFKWKKVAGATQYRYQVYRGTTLLYTKTVPSSACGATYCTNTPTTVLAKTAHKWRAQAYVGGVWKTYSAYKNFTVSVPVAGFNSSFNGSSTGWSPVYGSWTVGPAYYQTNGAANFWSSAKHTNTYGNFTYEVRMKRTGSDTNRVNNLVIRGKPNTLDADKMWKSSYIFEYANTGYFSVWRISATGAETALKSWTLHSAIVKNGWNTLKVIANGSSLKFYINNTLVWSGTSATFPSGQVGIMMHRLTSSTGDTLYVDWAKLTVAIAADENPFETVVPGVEVPGGSVNQSP